MYTDVSPWVTSQFGWSRAPGQPYGGGRQNRYTFMPMIPLTWIMNLLHSMFKYPKVRTGICLGYRCHTPEMLRSCPESHI